PHCPGHRRHEGDASSPTVRVSPAPLSSWAMSSSRSALDGMSRPRAGRPADAHSGHLEVEIRGHPRGQNELAAIVKILEWIEEDKAQQTGYDRPDTGPDTIKRPQSVGHSEASSNRKEVASREAPGFYCRRETLQSLQRDEAVD